jgi:hypothetical protein
MLRTKEGSRHYNELSEEPYTFSWSSPFSLLKIIPDLITKVWAGRPDCQDETCPRMTCAPAGIVQGYDFIGFVRGMTLGG